MRDSLHSIVGVFGAMASVGIENADLLSLQGGALAIALENGEFLPEVDSESTNFLHAQWTTDALLRSMPSKSLA